MLDLADAVNSVTYYNDYQFNSVKNNILDLVESSGQTPVADTGVPDTNVQQVSIASSIYAAGGYFYVDSGAADAYVLGVQTISGTPVRAPNVYFNGMTCRFAAGNTNTGISTVNVATLGVKTIKKANYTSDLAAGDIQSGFMYDIVYSTSTGFFELKPVFSQDQGTSIFFVDTNVVNNQPVPATWTDIDLSTVIGSNTALVYLRFKALGGVSTAKFRTNGDTDDIGKTVDNILGCGCSGAALSTNHVGYLWLKTDSSGVIEVEKVSGTNYSLDVLAYIK